LSYFPQLYKYSDSPLLAGLQVFHDTTHAEFVSTRGVHNGEVERHCNQFAVFLKLQLYFQFPQFVFVVVPVEYQISNQEKSNQT